MLENRQYSYKKPSLNKVKSSKKIDFELPQVSSKKKDIIRNQKESLQIKFPKINATTLDQPGSIQSEGPPFQAQKRIEHLQKERNQVMRQVQSKLKKVLIGSMLTDLDDGLGNKFDANQFDNKVNQNKNIIKRAKLKKIASMASAKAIKATEVAERNIKCSLDNKSQVIKPSSAMKINKNNNVTQRPPNKLVQRRKKSTQSVQQEQYKPYINIIKSKSQQNIGIFTKKNHEIITDIKIILQKRQQQNKNDEYFRKTVINKQKQELEKQLKAIQIQLEQVMKASKKSRKTSILYSNNQKYANLDKENMRISIDNQTVWSQNNFNKQVNKLNQYQKRNQQCLEQYINFRYKYHSKSKAQQKNFASNHQ